MTRLEIGLVAIVFHRFHLCFGYKRGGDYFHAIKVVIVPKQQFTGIVLTQVTTGNFSKSCLTLSDRADCFDVVKFSIHVFSFVNVLKDSRPESNRRTTPSRASRSCQGSAVCRLLVSWGRSFDYLVQLAIKLPKPDLSAGYRIDCSATLA